MMLHITRIDLTFTFCGTPSVIAISVERKIISCTPAHSSDT